MVPDTLYDDLYPLLKQYDVPVPRYTSYPTALDWDKQPPDENFLGALRNNSDTELALYCHIPFCKNRCLYCGCNVVISRRDAITERFLDYLHREIDIKADIAGVRKFNQLHLGGGTPNYLSPEQLENLVEKIHSRFSEEKNAELSIELDPMALSSDYLATIKQLGFNRISFGIQDVNKQTLEAVNRPQDLLHLNRVLEKAQRLGFDSINFDFIYGLPYQTLDSFRRNLQWIKMYRPDRIALFSYAHLPSVKHHQRQIPFKALPAADNKLELYLQSREHLLQMGYMQIGIDHFALPGDELVSARKKNALYRNFMGYSSRPTSGLLAFGPSAISFMGNVYAQNHCSLKSYQASIESGSAFFEKGMSLEIEDVMRAEIIQQLMNQYHLDIPGIETRYGVNFQDKFQKELGLLEKFAEQRLLSLERNHIEVTQRGVFVLRHIAAAFDSYRQKRNSAHEFSRGV